jgi:phosphoribosyl 1,2-cyclic phosphodiesterase
MDDQAGVPALPQGDGAHLCVLASGSSGNCSVLLLNRGASRRAMLIDLGLSPRRTMSLLANAGIRPDQIDGALITHLDHDHLHPTWRTGMPAHARVWMHHRHARHASRAGAGHWRIHAFDGEFAVDEHVRVRPAVMSHDELGVASFRIELTGDLGPASLGFATDLGHVPVSLLELFGQSPVDVLAIESNYCPVLQRASSRPEFLKQRIMGGAGHLSNQEALSAILQIEPREHVVLLHLSRECNTPETVAALHAGADYALTITSQHQPSRWVRVGGGRTVAGHAGASGAVRVRPQALAASSIGTLFGALGAGDGGSHA